MGSPEVGVPPPLSPRAKLMIIVVAALLIAVFIMEARGILAPFLWALVVAYLLNPVVNYLHYDGHMRRLAAVAVLYALLGILILAGSRYLYPRVIEQTSLFLEDIPRLEASLISLVGPSPLGMNVHSLISQLVSAGQGYTGNTKSASHLLFNAVETVVKIFLFLVTTFYLLIDAPRIKRSLQVVLPPAHRHELTCLAQQINLTWQQYIRGELVLFALMTTITSIGLTILQVPGAIFLGIVSGALELLPLVGPLTAGTLAVSVAYFNGTNQWGWSQAAYAGAVALMYLVLRQSEDYFVIPHVLGRAVRLHPLVVLFSVTTGGVVGGLFGLIIAVPVAASLKEISSYLYAKLLDRPVEFQPIRTLGGGVIEIPLNATPYTQPQEGSSKEGAGAS